MVKGTPSRRTSWAIALLLLGAGGAIVLLSRGGSRVNPTVGDAAPKVGDPTAGEALREDGRPPTAPDATLAGRGGAAGMTESSAGLEAPAPPEPAAPAASPADTGLPTRVVFVDAVTGREVPGVRWTDASDQILRVLAEARAVAAERGSPGAPPPVPTPLTEHQGGDVVSLTAPWEGIVVHPLEGWVSLGAKTIPSRRMPRAREGRMTVLLHLEADVRVEILGPDGRGPGAWVTEAFVAGTTIRQIREDRAPDGTRS
jgi:hypothetical protein